jgi:hypothetical protein
MFKPEPWLGAPAFDLFLTGIKIISYCKFDGDIAI